MQLTLFTVLPPTTGRHVCFREQAIANANQIQYLRGDIQGLRGSIWNLRQVLYRTESDVGLNDREISKLKLKDTDFSIDLSDLRLELSRTDLFAKATGFSTLGLIGGILLFGIIAFISYQVYNRKK